MRLVILDNYDKVSEWAAKYIRRRIIDFNPGPDKYFTLGLPTGIESNSIYYQDIPIPFFFWEFNLALLNIEF